MDKAHSIRYRNLGAEVRLAAIAIGPIAGLHGELAANRAESFGINIDKEALARVRRGDVHAPRPSTLSAIHRLGYCVGSAPTTHHFVRLGWNTANCEYQHTRCLKTPALAWEWRAELYALASERVSSKPTAEDPDKIYGAEWLSVVTIQRAANVAFDASDALGLQDAIGMNTVAAYHLACEWSLNLANSVRRWPHWESASPALVPFENRGGHTTEESKLERKRALQYAIAVQNAAVAIMSVHAIGVLRAEPQHVGDAHHKMTTLFTDFDLLQTFRFMDRVCEGTDLQLKYKRNLMLCYAVINDRKSFEREVTTFRKRFRELDPVEMPVPVKGESTYPPLKTDPSVQLLLN
jgi:hypothetical protein